MRDVVSKNYEVSTPSFVENCNGICHKDDPRSPEISHPGRGMNLSERSDYLSAGGYAGREFTIFDDQCGIRAPYGTMMKLFRPISELILFDSSLTFRAYTVREIDSGIFRNEFLELFPVALVIPDFFAPRAHRDKSLQSLDLLAGILKLTRQRFPGGFHLGPVKGKFYRNIQISCPERLYDIPGWLSHLGALDCSFICVGGQVYHGDAEKGANLLSRIYTVNGPLQDNIHQHQVRPAFHRLHDGIIAGGSDVGDNISQLFKRFLNMEYYYPFILDYQYLFIGQDLNLPNIVSAKINLKSSPATSIMFYDPTELGYQGNH